MAIKKRKIVETAYAELALAGHVFDLDGETSRLAMDKLDGMMGQWIADGVDVGYQFPVDDLDSDADDDSGLSFASFQAAYMSLAVVLAASHGKQLSTDTRAAASAGYNALRRQAAMPKGPYLPASFPMGAGNLRRGYVFTPVPDTSYVTIDPITGQQVTVE